ncbi:MAG: heterodisulfide reductase-related iron-sulfur binding cluster [Chloroflexota bacterium]|nr:heterodisulfide reductase-related iron-sulfur binding cluster [Chloroflexota bacterium]MDE2947707.1 heterodisulfide reductase-related iron-sulfur binding cluster [Chloroflexota bacterium]
MRHQIESDDLRAPEMATAIEKCVHCGFCLPACPTYSLLGEEMDSPRGRIYLMKNVLEETLSAADAQPYIDRCLGCMACVPACPSGVEYGDLLVSYRMLQERERQRPPLDALARRLVIETLPYPKRFRLAAQTGRIGKALRGALPEAFASMLNLLPEKLPSPLPAPPVLPARGELRAKVALLPGCVQQALAPEINYAAAQALAANGVEVHSPPKAGCCGSILLHVGAEQQAIELARRNFGQFPDDIDAIITTAAGCGSGIHDYELLFKDQPDADRAAAFARKVTDFSAFLSSLGMRERTGFAHERRVVYQDACHLLHAQGQQSEARALLMQIPNLRLLPIADAGMCCGSAGAYNIDQPAIAAELGRRKVASILAAEPDLVVSGNIGCITQLRQQLKSTGNPLPVRHIAEVLWEACAGSE